MSARQVPAPPRGRVRRVLGWAALGLALGAIAAGIWYVRWLDRHQAELIYRGRPTTAAEAAAARAAGAEILAFTVAGAAREAWLLPPTPGTPPALWVMCIGQGAVAAQWLEQPHYLVPSVHRHSGAAFLLIDYPGSGGNDGEPTPENVLALTRAAQAAALAQLGWERGRTAIGACGMSLGTGIAAAHAAAEGLDRLVLISPYTSLLAVARLRQPWPFWHLLRHRYDTVAALAELAARPQARVVIYHGDADTAIPVTMARELATCFPRLVRLREVAGAGHGDVLDAILPEAVEDLGDLLGK